MIKMFKDIASKKETLLDIYEYCVRENKSVEFKRYGNDMLVVKFM